MCLRISLRGQRGFKWASGELHPWSKEVVSIYIYKLHTLDTKNE